MRKSDKITALQNYNKVIYRKLENCKNTIERYMKITARLKEENNYLRKKVKKYEESNNSGEDRE